MKDNKYISCWKHLQKCRFDMKIGFSLSYEFYEIGRSSLSSKNVAFHQTTFIDITASPFACMVRYVWTSLVHSLDVFECIIRESPSMVLSNCTNPESVIDVLKQVSTLIKWSIK